MCREDRAGALFRGTKYYVPEAAFSSNTWFPNQKKNTHDCMICRADNPVANQTPDAHMLSFVRAKMLMPVDVMLLGSMRLL